MNKIFRAEKIACVLALACVLLVCGCSNPFSDIKKIEIVSDLGKDELFRINGESCGITEAKIFLVTQKNIYEESYGSEIWYSKLGGSVFSNYVKSDIKTFLTRFKVLKLMAEEYGAELSAEDVKYSRMAAQELYGRMTDSEKNYVGCTEENVIELFKEFRLIDIYLKEFTEDINMDISEDDARVITIQNILIKTARADDKGNAVELDSAEKEACYEKALHVYELLVNGSDFGTLAGQYSDSEQIEINIERGMLGGRFDEIAFSLEEGQVGEVVETEYGYHIIKCIDSYNEELTVIHKEEMQSEYKSEYYEEAYNKFIENVNARFNDELWSGIALNVNLELSGMDFFTVYYNYFE